MRYLTGDCRRLSRDYRDQSPPQTVDVERPIAIGAFRPDRLIAHHDAPLREPRGLARLAVTRIAYFGSLPDRPACGDAEPLDFTLHSKLGMES
jgi:hypothetical protein